MVGVEVRVGTPGSQRDLSRSTKRGDQMESFLLTKRMGLEQEQVEVVPSSKVELAEDRSEGRMKSCLTSFQHAERLVPSRYVVVLSLEATMPKEASRRRQDSTIVHQYIEAVQSLAFRFWVA